MAQNTNLQDTSRAAGVTQQSNNIADPTSPGDTSNPATNTMVSGDTGRRLIDTGMGITGDKNHNDDNSGNWGLLGLLGLLGLFGLRGPKLKGDNYKRESTVITHK